MFEDNKHIGKMYAALIGLLLVILVLCLTSCDTPKHIAKMQSKYCPLASDKKTDSVTIKIERHDSIVYVSSPTESIFIGMPCDSAKLKVFDVKQTKNGIHEEVKSNGKQIAFFCAADSLEKVISGLNKTIKQTIKNTEIKTIAPICNKEHTTDFQRFCVKFFWSFIILFILGVTGVSIDLYLKTIKKIP